MHEWDLLKDWICDVEIFEILYRTNRSLLEDSWKASMNDNHEVTPEAYAELDFDEIDSFFLPVIANDMATFLCSSFPLT